MIRHETISLLRAPFVPDEYGNEVRDWQNATARDVDGCSVQPVPGSEHISDRQTTVRRAVLYAPARAGLLATDRVRAGGVTYDVDGAPRLWPSPYGGPHHIEADLVAVEG